MNVRIRKYKDVLCEYDSQSYIEYIKPVCNKFGGYTFKAFEDGQRTCIDLKNTILLMSGDEKQSITIADDDAEISDVEYKVFHNGDIVIFTDTNNMYGQGAYGITDETAICMVRCHHRHERIDIDDMRMDLFVEVIYSSSHPEEIGSSYSVSSLRFDIADKSTIVKVYNDTMAKINELRSTFPSFSKRVVDLDKVLNKVVGEVSTM